MAAVGMVLALVVGGPSRSSLEAITRDSSDLALVEWAVDRFDRAGLDLPPLQLEFHGETTPCQGYYGSFTDSDPVQVDICGFNNNRFLPAPKKMILHELAHAWLFHNLDEGTKTLFLEFRDLETWNDPTVDWSLRGFEQAAEVIAWALFDEERRLLTVPESQPGVFANAYTLLTGRSLPER